MSERSRAVCGNVEIPPPDQSDAIVCRVCWSALGYRHDHCWACGHPVADAFAGDTEVVTSGPFDDLPQTMVSPVDGPGWWTTSGTMVALRPPLQGWPAPIVGPRERAAANDDFDGPSHTMVAPSPEPMGPPAPASGFEEQAQTSVFDAPSWPWTDELVTDELGHAGDERECTHVGPGADDGQTRITGVDHPPLSIDHALAELWGEEATLVSPAGPAPVVRRWPPIRKPIPGADGHA